MDSNSQSDVALNRKRKSSPPSLSNPPSPSAAAHSLKSPFENSNQPGLSKTERRKNKKLKKAEAKTQNEKPPSLSFAGGELRKRKAPISVEEVRDVFLHLFADGAPTKFLVIENPRSILRAVLLLIPGITPASVGADDPPVSSAYPISISTGGSSKIPAINACYSHACPTRATGEPTKMHSVLATVLQSPISGEQKRKRLLERQQQKSSNDASMYMLDTPSMLDNGYPIPSYLGEGLELNPESLGSTNGWPAPAPVAQTRENGWVETPVCPPLPEGQAPKIIALDCEMCETEDGKVLARVCAINYSTEEVVYDQLVQPDKPVIDYLTQFSGITAEQLAPVTLKLADAQAGLLEIIDGNTILLGHSLENDLRALKLAHPRCIDTSVIYKHPRGAPYKPGLKWLAQKWLNREIQVVTAVLEAAQNHDFVFGRLLGLSQVLEWTTPRAQPGTDTPITLPPAQIDPTVADAGYAALSERIAKIHKGLPSGTALCIMSGNGDPRIMSGLNAKKARWDGYMRERKKPEEIPQTEWWTMEEGRLLEDVTERAKRGLSALDTMVGDLNDPRRHVQIHAESVSHVASTDFPGVYPGEDHSWDFEQFKQKLHVEVRATDEDAVDFDLVGVDASVANAFRRILMAEVPTIAIEKVYIWNNTSVIQDE
ncbi:hypothetical protein FRC07_012728, partial [Ceratobasidium sp. 392]